MASALQDLRKMAGFKNAKDFAAEMDIPLATYTRYESSPEKIPLKAAWVLADWFDVPLDVIVGRGEIDVNAIRGDVQQAYDSLTPRSQQAFDEYLYFLMQKDGDIRRRIQEEENRKMDEICLRYERMYLAQLESKEEFGDLTAFGSPEEQRSGFQEFVETRAAEKRAGDADEAKRAKRDKATIAKLMDAYDRTHETYLYEDGTIHLFSTNNL